MLTKRIIKQLNSLKEKKHRSREGLFLVEGFKSVRDVCHSKNIKIAGLYATEDNLSLLAGSEFPTPEIVSSGQMRQISSQSTPDGILAVCRIPHYAPVDFGMAGLYLALDGISDPGNMGTILRLADWFGVDDVFCSEDCVDVYNPKAVQASMGSIARVKVHYVNLVEMLAGIKIPVYGTFLQGENIYQTKLEKHAVLVVGNEANGISDYVGSVVTSRITIPRFRKGPVPESLNAAMATSIALSEFCRF